MAIRHTSDSLSSCDPTIYSNIYDVRSRSDVKGVPAASPSIRKDTLEISRDKLKKEALNRLRHTSKYLIFQNGFMRVGKYLFLAIAFPPYLVVYGIPKWILFEGLPALMSTCMTFAKKVKQKIKKRVEAVRQKIAQTVQFIQQRLYGLVRPIIRLGLDIYQAFHRMRQTTQFFFKRLIANTKVAPRLNIAKLMRRLQARGTSMREWTSQKTSLIFNQIQEGLIWIKQAPQIGLAWGTIQLRRVNEQVKGLSQTWKATFQASQLTAQSATRWLFKQFQLGKQQAKKRLFEPFQKIYRSWLKVACQQVYASYRTKLTQLGDFLNQKRKQALTVLQQGQESLKKLSFRQASDWLLSSAVLKGMPTRLQQIVHVLLFNSISQICLKVTFEIGSFISLRTLQVLSLSIKAFARTIQAFSSFRRRGSQMVIQAWLVGSNYVSQGVSICSKGAEKGMYSLLLLLIMLGIVGLWGFRLLGESMHALTSALFKGSSKKVRDVSSL